VTGPETFTTNGTFKAATLSRGRVVYATGKGRRLAHGTDLVLQLRRHLTAGHYVLKLGTTLDETVTVL
jgi:hypothetical protein